MKSRIATGLSLIALIGATGGAVAIGDSPNSAGDSSAASGQYKPGKGCGDKNHTHTGTTDKKPCPPQSQH